MAADPLPYQDSALAPAERAADLAARMTGEEKIAQMVHNAPSIPRLGVPEHNWWNEVLHGVARAGIATVFPQGIGLAAMWNRALHRRVAEAISDEARAKHHAHASLNDRGIYKGLTAWTPNINLFRDPRWGRGQETYGECPYLTGELAKEFVRGLQGDDPRFIKIVATPKHFAVHSGPEVGRHGFNTTVSPRDLWESYLPHFRATVVEAGAWSVMGAYNRVDGEPACAHTYLMEEVLRGHWGFPGYVVSDCGAIADFHNHHGVTETEEESAALAVRKGCDLNCGCVYPALPKALDRGLVTEAEIGRCVARLMEARIRLGQLDPEEENPYAKIPYDVVACDEHRALALEAARQSLVLLKNDGALPLGPETIKTIAVIGPNADDREVLLGNYNGIPLETITPLQGIRAAAAARGVKVIYQIGCLHHTTSTTKPGHYFTEALLAAERADVVVLCLGLTPEQEGEEGDAYNPDGGADRRHLNVSEEQQRLLELMLRTGKPVIVHVSSGSAVAIPRAEERAAAIVQQFYAGEAGGTALAEVLFGDYNPGGRLPVTIYRDVADLPPFEDYAMTGRTYRFFDGTPLFPFGFGLSFTRFEYGNVRLVGDAPAVGQDLLVEVTVRNAEARAGTEVIQLYARHENAPVPTPGWQLVQFDRIELAPGESKTVRLAVAPRSLAVYADDGRPFLYPALLRLSVGGSQADPRSQELGAPRPAEVLVQLAGERQELPW